MSTVESMIMAWLSSISNYDLADRRNKCKDFNSLRKPETITVHNDTIKSLLAENNHPQGATEKLKRLSKVMQSAQSVLPDKPKVSMGKWEISQATLNLLQERSEKWDKLSYKDKINYKKAISRSARSDYREHVNNIITDIEADIAAGKTSDIFVNSSVSVNSSKRKPLYPTIRRP